MAILNIRDKDGKFIPIPALQGAPGKDGASGVHVGSTPPTSGTANVWIDPNGETTAEPQYELIETVTFEEAMALERTAEPDGTPYKFSRMLLLCDAPPGEENPADVSARFPGTSDQMPIANWSGSTTSNIAHYGEIWVQNGYWRSTWGTNTNYFVWSTSLTGFNRIDRYKQFNHAYRYIAGLRSGVFRAGSVLKIYAIRYEGE